MKPRFTFVYREGCSLCEAMAAEIEALPERARFDLVALDVDGDPVLAQRYGAMVPVLRDEEGELCHYFLDPDVVRRYFEQR